MAVVSYRLEFEFRFKAFLREILILSTYLYRLSLDTAVSSHHPNLYAWALNYLTGCIPVLLREVQNKSSASLFFLILLLIWVHQDHTESRPFLPFLINSLTNPFQLFTLNMHCMWLLFSEGELYLTATPVIIHAMLHVKGPGVCRCQTTAVGH